MERIKRSTINFYEHVVTKTEMPGVLIHEFAKPGTRCCSVVFINTQGILAVTGDFGNWIFCREFHPSHDGFVSDHYWCEKIRMRSTQRCADYSAKETEKEIRERMKEEDLDDEDREYLEDLLNHLDECEERYMIYAYDNLPKNRDHEFIPIVKEMNPWLDAIFDAFDEICRREPAEKEEHAAKV